MIDLMIQITDNPVVVLLLIDLIVLVLGCFLEGNAILILVVPIVVPIAQRFNIDLVHLGVIMCLADMMGTITPPVGMCLYPVCTLGSIKMQSLVKELVPFFLILTVVLLLVTFFPPLSTFLPNALMGAG